MGHRDRERSDPPAGASRRRMLSNGLLTPRPRVQVTSKLTDIQRLTGPRVTSELINKRYSLREAQPLVNAGVPP